MGRISGDVEQLLTIVRPDTARFLRKMQPRGVSANLRRPVHQAAAPIEERERENSRRPLLQLAKIEDRGQEGQLRRGRQNGERNCRRMRTDVIDSKDGVPTDRPARVNQHSYLKCPTQTGGDRIARCLIVKLVREQQLRKRSRVRQLIALSACESATCGKRNAAIEQEGDLALRDKTGDMNSQNAAGNDAGASFKR